MLSFLERIQGVGARWVAPKGRYFSVREGEQSDAHMLYGQKRFPLRPGKMIKELERESYVKALQEIAIRADANVRFLNPRIRRQRRRASGLDALIMEGLVPECERQLFDHDHGSDLRMEQDAMLKRCRTGDYLMTQPFTSHLSSQIGRIDGLCVLTKRAFALRRANVDPEVSIVNGSSVGYRLIPLGTEKDLVRIHKRSVAKRINDESRRIRSLVEKDVSEHNDRVRAIVDMPKDYGVKVTKNGKNYRVLISGQPFVMKRGDDHYLFGKYTAGYDIITDDGGYSLTRPKITFPKPYSHPFVFDDNRICFNHGDQLAIRFEGMKFETRYPYPDDSEGLAGKLALPASETIKVLHEGYFGKLTPVSILEKHGAKKKRRENISDEVRIYEVPDK